MADFEFKAKWFPIVTALKSPNTFKNRLDKEYDRAAKITGLKVSALMRKKIKSGGWDKNAPMTVEMKGSNKPLVDEGRLFKSVTFRATSKGAHGGPAVMVGVMRSSKSANVARILVSGAKITVTPKMSRFFKMLHAASVGRKSNVGSERGQQILAKAKGTIPALKVGTTLVIPPRNFVTATLKDPLVAAIVETEFTNALKRTLESLAK